MRIPIEFRLLMLLVLAWRLILMAKKKFDFGQLRYEDLYSKRELNILKPEIKDNLRNTYQEYYRKVVRGNENQNRFYFIVFLAQKIDKHYKKGGIFRLFWFDQSLVICFHQSLLYLNLHSEAKIFEKILTKLSLEGFEKLKNGQIENILPDTFSVHGDDHLLEYNEFDKAFSLEEYLKALHTIK